MKTLVSLMLACAMPLVSTSMAAEPDTAQMLAPTGRLRAAINFGNPVSAERDTATEQPHGVSAELGRELGRRLGVPVQFLTCGEAGLVVAAARQDVWDVAFLAVDPTRGKTIEFTSPSY